MERKITIVMEKKTDNQKLTASNNSERGNTLLYIKEYDNSLSPESENAFKDFYDRQGSASEQTSNVKK